MIIIELDEYDGLLFYINLINYKYGFNIINMVKFVLLDFFFFL